MPGGKQKLAAKIKKYKQNQELIRLQNLAQQTQQRLDYSGGGGSGDHSNEEQRQVLGNLTEQDLNKIRNEVWRQRARRRRDRSGTNWFSRWIDRSMTRLENIPYLSVVATVLLSILVFFLCRTLILALMPASIKGIDRRPLFDSFRKTLPGPLYKFVLLLDYMFTSSTLSWSGVQDVLSAPDEKKFQEFLRGYHG